jgi:two-component system OmpR family response regulator
MPLSKDTMFFPDPDAHPPVTAKSSTGYELPPPPGLRVICVDDNEDAADSLGTLLTMVGCEVIVAHDAVSALDRIDEFQPQICLLDITMPGMNGCELARRLRESPGGDRMLLVALTALGDYRSLEWMADSGFDQHFTKPVALSELYAAFNDFAARS